eukprot:CAMPEP_0184380496 /NCGR_PEP_ID=MMETSP0007-20130409/4797_1 /TAXON_ID=97485 /ORGANISM="Prymnesium parvum, Strain Texoma1" /LENGTH=72 /DNA_ID=CAMNT_0026725751 /DNA_START=121 /DNA_END=335 /DNA_ORIENTATION=+
MQRAAGNERAVRGIGQRPEGTLVAQGTNEHGRAVCKVISRRMAGGGASACVVVRWDRGGPVMGEGAEAERIT